MPTDAPEGLCPVCVMQALAATEAGAPGSQPAAHLVNIADAAEVAKRLPQFEIIELLGRGGMGVVYKARQPQLDRVVAIKILPPEDSLSQDFIARFTREARSLAKLNHPNIVTVHDFGESDGLYYFIMEFVDGANLRQLFQAKKITADEALAIVPKVCDALEYAHEEGVVHRDIKPENILVDKKGRVKIADFGLAKLLRREALDVTLTLAGSTLGTLRYMAPEQMDKPETVDHRADIYSLGVVIYEMLTGETPVGRFQLPSQMAKVDTRLDEIVMHALEKEPSLRYQHASEVKADVENVTSRPASPAMERGAISPIDSTTPVKRSLSRAAIIGAVWACLGSIATVPLLVGLFSMTRDGLNITDVFMTLSVLVPLITVIGTTIFGIVAVTQIKRSGIRLYGLPLAFAEALSLPMLLIHALMTLLLGVIAMVGVKALTLNAGLGALEIAVLALLPLIADFVIVRALWRKVAGIQIQVTEPAARVRRAAIALLVSGVTMGITVIAILSGALSPHVSEKVFALLVCAPCTVFIVRGALTMLNGEDYAASKRAALCSLAPQLMWIVGLPAAIYALVLLNKPEVKAMFGSPDKLNEAQRFQGETWWFGRSRGVQQLMGIVLGVVLVVSLIAFLTFNMTTTTTADHSGVVRNLTDFTVGAGDPWLYLLHRKTGTRGGFESGMNLIAGSALFGYAALCAGLALTRLTREQKRRRELADASTDTPQQKFFWNAVAAAVLFIAAVAGVIVHEVRNDNNGGLLADAVHEVHPDFTRPGITSIALKKAIADELKLTPEQLEKINGALNHACLDFLKLENEHSLYRSENAHLVKITKPFPDRSFDLAKKLAAELRGIAGKSIIDEPERNTVWKLRLFRHAGEFEVRAELWEKDGAFHREETWERNGKKVMGGKSGDTLTDLSLVFGHYLLDWEMQKDNIHEPRPDDATSSRTLGADVVPFFVERIRNAELARRMAVKDPDTVVKSGNPHAALVTQAGTDLGRACAETELQRHGIPFAKGATPEELVIKLEALLGKPTP